MALRDWPNLLITAFAMVSTLWSADPTLTLRRAIALAGTCWVGWYLGTRYAPRELLKLVALAFGALTMVSFGAATLTPWGVVNPLLEVTADAPAYATAWRGVFPTKNLLAQVMVLSAVTLFVLAASRRRGSRLAFSTAALSCFIVWAAYSVTAMVVLLTMLASVVVLLYWVRDPRRIGLVVSGAFLLSAGMTWLALERGPELARAAGRDATLTGRTAVWEAANQEISRRWLLGSGHASFWRGWEGEGSRRLEMRAGWTPGYAHNGFIDQALTLGLPGVVLLVLCLLSVGSRASVFAARERDAASTWPLLLVTFLTTANLTEGGLFQQNNYMWLLLVAASASLRKHMPGRLEAKRHRPHCQRGVSGGSGATRYRTTFVVPEQAGSR
jgi:O-antigen ligase